MSDTHTADVTTDVSAPHLSLGAIDNAIKVIDYAAEQGAFKGWEVIEKVLGVRNELMNFLAAASAATAATETDETVSPAEGA